MWHFLLLKLLGATILNWVEIDVKQKQPQQNSAEHANIEQDGGAYLARMKFSTLHLNSNVLATRTSKSIRLHVFTLQML